jgi:hypothetical protein
VGRSTKSDDGGVRKGGQVSVSTTGRKSRVGAETPRGGGAPKSDGVRCAVVSGGVAWV